MPLTVPTLDDRTYEELLREALARVPVHNPEWTNFNDSDPGMTLVQLFAFLTESLLYRSNQIPERNRKKFLTMLGIGLQPAAPSQGLVTIRNERGPLAAQTVDANLDVRAGSIRFRTTYGLGVLPVEARAFYKHKLADPQTEEEAQEREIYRLLYADLLDQPDTEPAFYESRPMPEPEPDGALPVVDLVNDTVDRCLWIALLARPREDPATVRSVIAGKTLTVGLMPGTTAQGLTLPPGQIAFTKVTGRVAWEVASPPPGGQLPPISADPTGRVATYALLPARATANPFSAPTLVEVMLPAGTGPETWINLEPAEEGTGDFPPSLADTDLQDRVITWLRLRLREDAPAAGGEVPQALISWVGINATTVVQRTDVASEVIGTGTGEPDQCYTLANTPILPDTLDISIAGEKWERIDDLLAATPEVPVGDPRQPLYLPGTGTPVAPSQRTKVYTLDPESGQVCFGDGAHGMRPRPGEVITASYAYGGGRQGNVGAGAISSSPGLPPGFKVTNALSTWGGDDAEEVTTAEKTIPAVVKHGDRLVSVSDFYDITRRTPGVDLGRIEVLPLYDPIEKLDDMPGVVTVMVIPARDPRTPDAPQPDLFFLEAVCRYLQPRRLVTTELHVRGPLYKNIFVSVGVTVLGGYATATVLRAVEDALRAFLSPLTGGRSATGWPLGVPVLQRELESIVSRVDGVQLVEALYLGGPEGDNISSANMSGLDLPRLAALQVTTGAPPPLSELRQAPSAAPEGKLAPIPVIPERC